MPKSETYKMRGGVRRRGPSGAWSYFLELGVQPAQRCNDCNHRAWVGHERLESCPQCGGTVRETHERRQLTMGGFRTRAEAVAARADRTRTLRDGTFVEPTKLTLAEYLRERWLPAIRGENLKPLTLASYESLAIHHLIGPERAPYLIGLTQLQKLTREAIKAHYAQLAESGRANGGTGGLSPASVRRVHAILSRALNDAVESGLIVRNPARGVTKRLPKVNGTGGPKAWTAEQLGAFLHSVREDRLSALWRLLAMTGMRRGEALALRWDDVDLAAGCVSVSKSRVPVGKTVVESTTKTDRARVTDLDTNTVEVLRGHAATQADELAGRPQAPADRYVFTDADGEPLDPNRVSRRFIELVGSAVLPGLSIHGLRHTHATVALEAGENPKHVQERLGHASIAITMDTYSHVIRQDARDVAQRIADLVKSETR